METFPEETQPSNLGSFNEFKSKLLITEDDVALQLYSAALAAHASRLAEERGVSRQELHYYLEPSEN